MALIEHRREIEDCEKCKSRDSVMYTASECDKTEDAHLFWVCDNCGNEDSEIVPRSEIDFFNEEVNPIWPCPHIE